MPVPSRVLKSGDLFTLEKMGTSETRPELSNPRTGHRLHHEMRAQALKIQWSELAATVERLIVWRSFGLWVRAIVDAERSLPVSISAAIRDRCPGFLESQRSDANLESLWLDLSGWIDNHFFAAARDGGWLEAVHYYSGHAAASENIWKHWTRMDADWRKQRPTEYPAFEKWHQDALGRSIADDIAVLPARYLEWEAFAFWVRDVVEAAHEFPALVEAELERRCPGFTAHAREQRAKLCSDPQWLWGELLDWIESHNFKNTSSVLSLDDIRSTAHSHLRGERIADYAAECSLKWSRQLPTALPDFDQWLVDADAYVVV